MTVLGMKLIGANTSDEMFNLGAVSGAKDTIGHMHANSTGSRLHEQSKLPVVSLFSGAGGLDLAVDRAAEAPLASSGPKTEGPYRVAVATDYSQQALQTLSLNLPTTETIARDIKQTPTEELLEAGSMRKGDPAIVIGGPPCTPFSKSGFWLAEKRESRDPNASLLEAYVKVVADTMPEAFVLENVQALTYKTHKAHFENLLAALKVLGYNPQWKILSAADYGVPQLRKRVFIVGRRDGRPFKFPEPTHAGPSETSKKWDQSKIPHVSTREAFKGLINEPEINELVEGKYGELAAEIPAGQNYLWHTSRYGGRDIFKWRSRYWTFLLRISPQKPSSTLQAQPGPYVGPFHWENLPNETGELRARRLRVPELRRLMTFPDNFEFVGNRSDIQKQLGNAVPLELGKAVFRALSLQLGHLEAESESDQAMIDQGVQFRSRSFSM